MEAGLEGIDASDVSFLPIVSTYARELGVVEEINRLCGRTKGVNAGQVFRALILDTLTGRSPLFSFALEIHEQSTWLSNAKLNHR